MKFILFTILFTLLFIPLFFFAQQNAGIYSIYFPISKNLLQPTRVQSSQSTVGGVGNLNSGNLVANRNFIPPFAPFLHDSVRITLEKFVSEVLSSEAVCIFKMNKKNETISSSGFPGSISGLPRSCLRNAIKFHDNDYYVRVKVSFGGYNVASPSLFGFQRGYIQPAVRIRIRAYDVERKKIYSRKFRYTNFPQLKNVQISGFGSGVKVIQQEILSSEMIFSMLKETIFEYKKKYHNQE
jgi:hypothetical protein